MKFAFGRLAFGVCLFVAASSASALNTASADASELKMFVTEVSDNWTPEMLGTTLTQDCGASTAPGTIKNEPTPTNPLGPIEMIADSIINIGKKLWAIVDAGRPVVNLKMDVGTALPQGARCWMDLQTWNVPTSHRYQVSFVNGFNSEIVKFDYRVISLAGGSIDGKGKYIGYAAFQPVNVEVAWGFEFNAEAAVPAVFNMGSKAEPVAGLQIVMNYKVTSPLKFISQSQAYFMDGKGSFEQMK